MKRQRFEFETIHLEAKDRRPQFRQLEDHLREAINKGLLTHGTRLPSSRGLAALLGISRNTVVTAYDQLICEGYLETRKGSGTIVSGCLSKSNVSPKKKGNADIKIGLEALSKQGRHLAKYSSWLKRSGDSPTAFRPHIPALDHFPIRIWNQLTVDQSRRYSIDRLQLTEPQGYRPLRQAISEYMGIARGVACEPEQVVVTSSAQQGFQLIAQLLLDPGDEVWMEEPGGVPSCEPFRQSGARVIPVTVDDEGIQIDLGRKLAPNRKMICVTPGAQWPTAKAMSLSRRIALMEEVRRKECWIIEDDYNGEYRYRGRPHAPLCSLDSSGRTIYMGTFSKMLFPSIRLSFLIVPKSLASSFSAARWIADRSSSLLTQMVLYRFIDEGYFSRHIRMMRTLYDKRLRFLFDTLNQAFGIHIQLDCPDVGMHLLLKGATQEYESRLIEAANRAQVEHHLVANYAINGSRMPGMILGFAGYDQDQVEKAIVSWKNEFYV